MLIVGQNILLATDIHGNWGTWLTHTPPLDLWDVFILCISKDLNPITVFRMIPTIDYRILESITELYLFLYLCVLCICITVFVFLQQKHTNPYFQDEPNDWLWPPDLGWSHRVSPGAELYLYLSIERLVRQMILAQIRIWILRSSCRETVLHCEPECLCRLLMALHPMAGASREPSKYKTLFVKFDFYGSHNMAHIIWMSQCMSCLRSPKAISQALASMNKLPPGIKPIISHSPPLHGFICLDQL